MAEKRKYRARFWTAAVRVLVYGVLIGFVLRTVAVSHWLGGIVWGMILGAAIVFLRQTTVEIEGEEIRICGRGPKECFLLSQFAYPSVKRKTYIGSYSKYTAVKCDLVFMTSEGLRSCRLYGFGEKDMEKVLGAVREARAERLTDEEKAYIAKEYYEEASEALLEGRQGRNEFLLPASVLMKKEKEGLRKVSLLMTGIILLVAMIDAKEMLVHRMLNWKLAYMTMLAFMLLVCVIGMQAGLAMRRGICAERVIMDGDRLYVGGDSYSYFYITSIGLTSPRKRSSSVFPVQRFLYVSAGGNRKKYWLGSEVSFGEYESLCRCLEQRMVFCPSKFRYV